MLVVVAQGPRLGPLLETNQRLVQTVARSGEGRSVFAATSLLPPPSVQRDVGRAIAAANISPAALGDRVNRAAGAAGFKPGAFEPFLARAGTLLDPTSRLTWEGYVERGLEDLLSPYVARTPGGFVTAAYVRPRSREDVDAVRAAVHAVGSPLQLTGLPVVNEELADRLVPQFLLGVGLGAVAVFVLIWLTFRNVRLTLLALLPTALGLVWGAGLLALFGVVIDLFSLFAVLAFIGIGVDYGIHLVHRYAAEGDLVEALARIAPVNLVAAGIAVLGCGTLIFSSYPPLHSLGVVSVVTLVTCLAGSLLVLPAALGRR
jgi:predicted exporter